MIAAGVFIEAFINSLLLVFVGEMGDKTQLLSLVLVARYKKPWTILAGVTVATLLNHGLASWIGGLAAGLLSPMVLKWSLALTFFAFAVWVLIPDKEEEVSTKGHWGAFVATTIAFFLAEMGDKTQLATIALGASYSNVLVVTLGTTLGMIGANALAVFMGEKLLQRISMKWVRVLASLLFLGFGVLILIEL